MDDNGKKTFLIKLDTRDGKDSHFEFEVDPEKDFSIIMARQALKGNTSKDWSLYKVADLKSIDGIWYPSKIEHVEYLFRTSGEAFHSMVSQAFLAV